MSENQSKFMYDTQRFIYNDEFVNKDLEILELVSEIVKKTEEIENEESKQNEEQKQEEKKKDNEQPLRE